LSVLAIAAAAPAGAATIDLITQDMLVNMNAVTGGTGLTYAPSSTSAQGIGSNDAFLEVRQSGGTGSEQGYNTDATIQFSTTQSAEAVLLSDVPLVSIGGVAYYEIGLAVNSSSNTLAGSAVSLDEFQIFQSDSSVLDDYDAAMAGMADDTLDGLSPVFDWFGDGSSSDHALVYDHQGGQSDIDHLFYVPASAIDASLDYFYLYVEMGFVDDADDGEDRWVVDRTNSPFGYCGEVGLSCTSAPEPGGAALLLGLGILAVGAMAIRR
jgi:hypothetical protein